jgi:DNA-binding NtrC family response regulator
MTVSTKPPSAADGHLKRTAEWAREAADQVAQPSRSMRADGTDAQARHVGLVGRSSSHLQLLMDLRRAAQVDVEIFIYGETGVGKELYARYVHECSSRSENAFVAINCSAIPDTLFENEMFGHSAGAYTDARTRSEGLVTAADGGTLFFDEVDHLPPAAQVKLLRLLQEKEYRRLGETRVRRANVRVISATNTEPERAIECGGLRQDLYYRLNVIQCRVAPLRERPDDVAPLVAEFSERYSAEYGRERTLQFTEGAQAILEAYHWPGNTRQLENVVRCLVCQHPSDRVDTASIPVVQPHESVRAYVTQLIDVLLALPFCDAKRHIIDRFTEEYLTRTLQRAEGNISRAAKLAGKNRRAFFELMRKHKVDAAGFRNNAEVKSGVDQPTK